MARAVALVRDERRTFEARCNELLSEATAAMDTTLDVVTRQPQWMPIHQSEQLALYRATAPAVDNAANKSAMLRVLGSGYLSGSLEHIMRGLYSDQDVAHVTMQTILNPTATSIDGAVLNVVEQRDKNAQFRFAGVKWTTWKDDHDFYDLLTYERMGMTIDQHGKLLAYQTSYAIPTHPDWPRGPRVLCRRLGLSMCVLFRCVSDDLIECFIMGEYPAKASSTQQRIVDAAVADRALQVTRALHSCSARKLSVLMDKGRMTPVVMRKTCHFCPAREWLQICGICRRCVCRDCRKTKTIFRLNSDTHLPEEEVFCVRCLQKARLPVVGPAPPMKAKTTQIFAHRERPRERAVSAERYSAAHSFNYDEFIANHERASTYDGPSSIPPGSSSPRNRAPIRIRSHERAAAPIQRSTEPVFSNVPRKEPQDPLLMANRRSALVQQQFQSFLERQKVVDKYKDDRSTIIKSTPNQESENPLRNGNRRSAQVQEEFESYVERQQAMNERQKANSSIFKPEEPEDPCLIAHRRSAVVKKQLEPFDRRKALIDPEEDRSTELIDTYEEELEDPFLVANRRSAFVQQEFESYVERRNANNEQAKQVRFRVPRSSAPVLPSQLQERFSQPFERKPVARRVAAMNRSHSCPVKETDIDLPRAPSATPMPRSNQLERRRNAPLLAKKVSWTES